MKNLKFEINQIKKSIKNLYNLVGKVGFIEEKTISYQINFLEDKLDKLQKINLYVLDCRK